MKLTNKQLKQIIKEEVAAVLKEGAGDRKRWHRERDRKIWLDPAVATDDVRDPAAAAEAEGLRVIEWTKNLTQGNYQAILKLLAPDDQRSWRQQWLEPGISGNLQVRAAIHIHRAIGKLYQSLKKDPSRLKPKRVASMSKIKSWRVEDPDVRDVRELGLDKAIKYIVDVLKFPL